MNIKTIIDFAINRHSSTKASAQTHNFLKKPPFRALTLPRRDGILKKSAAKRRNKAEGWYQNER
jgi:hypothetical protein